MYAPRISRAAAPPGRPPPAPRPPPPRLAHLLLRFERHQVPDLLSQIRGDQVLYALPNALVPTVPMGMRSMAMLSMVGLCLAWHFVG